MKLFKLIGWGQPAVGCFISREGMGEGEASITAAWWGNSLLAGEEAFLQAKAGARAPTWAWDMPDTVSVARGGFGEGAVWLSACVSMGFSWAQCSGVTVEASLKTLV